jgi:hypothetical protein
MAACLGIIGDHSGNLTSHVQQNITNLRALATQHGWTLTLLRQPRSDQVRVAYRDLLAQARTQTLTVICIGHGNDGTRERDGTIYQVKGKGQIGEFNLGNRGDFVTADNFTRWSEGTYGATQRVPVSFHCACTFAMVIVGQV